MDKDNSVESTEQGTDNHDGQGKDKDGYTISRQTLLLASGGALVALAFLGIEMVSSQLKPAGVSLAKEVYGFKDWFMSKVERVIEDVEDIISEAKHGHYKDIQADAESVKREKEMLEKVEAHINKKVERKQAKPKEE
ncbi:MAG: hypothetical protein HQL06_13770 [Nitrospirae bacterium]|nr:hypothetical protein [Nitrospirota bacterium]